MCCVNIVSSSIWITLTYTNMNRLISNTFYIAHMQSVCLWRILKDVSQVDWEDDAMPVQEATVTRLAQSATDRD